MAATPKALSRADLPSSPGTIYTATGVTAVITNIILVNHDSAARTATILLDGVSLIPAVSLLAGQVLPFDLKQVLASTKVITGSASAGSAVSCHISGVEVA